MGKNFMTQLKKHDGYVSRDIDLDNGIIRFPSPSANFAMGKPYGLRRGCSIAVGGPSESGKSYLFYATVGLLHKMYPDAYAIKYDAEFRDQSQLTPEQAKLFGIDLDRYVCYQTNKPDEIFDHLTHDVADLCDQGMDLALVGIDSLNMIQGIRMMNNDSVMDQTIGDLAQTIPTGLKKVLPLQKKFRWALYHVVQVRNEMDPWEIKRNGKFRLAIPPAVQHLIDYWAYIEANNTQDGKKDLAGKEFVNDKVKDLMEKGDQTGFKVRFKIKKSSYGIKGRTGEYTLNFRSGIINTHEEVYALGKNRGVIKRENNTTYTFKDKKWTGGQPSVLEALKNNKDLCDEIISEVHARDINPKDDDAEIVSENE